MGVPGRGGGGGQGGHGPPLFGTKWPPPPPLVYTHAHPPLAELGESGQARKRGHLID